MYIYITQWVTEFSYKLRADLFHNNMIFMKHLANDSNQCTLLKVNKIDKTDKIDKKIGKIDKN